MHLPGPRSVMWGSCEIHLLRAEQSHNISERHVSLCIIMSLCLLAFSWHRSYEVMTCNDMTCHMLLRFHSFCLALSTPLPWPHSALWVSVSSQRRQKADWNTRTPWVHIRSPRISSRLSRPWATSFHCDFKWMSLHWSTIGPRLVYVGSGRSSQVFPGLPRSSQVFPGLPRSSQVFQALQGALCTPGDLGAVPWEDLRLFLLGQTFRREICTKSARSQENHDILISFGCLCIVSRCIVFGAFGSETLHDSHDSSYNCAPNRSFLARPSPVSQSSVWISEI